MYHFFVAREQIYEDFIIINGTDVNHIKNVLRMKKGENVLISDGEGNDYQCVISDIAAEEVRCGIISNNEAGTELPSEIYLFQGLPKSDKMELIIQKAVELGVYEIIPVSTKRSVVKLDEKKAQSRVKRWCAIAESAAKQSKRSIIPQVLEIKTYKEACEYAKNFDICIIPYECAEDMSETRKIINNIKPGMRIGIFIGPEGGFEEAEVAFGAGYGMKPVTLGKRILRTETAGIAILSILGFMLEDQGE